MPPTGVFSDGFAAVSVSWGGGAAEPAWFDEDPNAACPLPPVAPLAPFAAVVQPVSDLFDQLLTIADRWKKNFRYWQQLEAIDYWGAQLRAPASRGKLAHFEAARRALTTQFTAPERAAIWAAVSQHYYVLGEVAVQPVAYRRPRDAVGRCVQDARLRAECIPPGDTRREDPMWLTALLSLDPRPVSTSFNERVLAATFSGAQLTFARPTTDDVLIYAGELPRADGSRYGFSLEFNDGFDVGAADLEAIIGMVHQYNGCLPGMEVERIVFEQAPLVAPDWISSYYSSASHEIHVMARPQTALDELTHEFGHAIDRRRESEWRTRAASAPCPPIFGEIELASLDPVTASVVGAEWLSNPERPTDPHVMACSGRHVYDQLGALFTTSVDRLDVLAVIKDSYYTDHGVNNVYHGLLNRGHPEDGLDETLASLFNVMVRYPESILDNISHPDTPPQQRVALWELWQRGQQWLGLACPHFPTREIMLDDAPGIVRLHVPDPPALRVEMGSDPMPVFLF
ncbi:MAG: hypothetical protein HY696_12285 [Deltaproteobacteria bacterium]|nr:hypothetical protein [Deltaproteobacteria bacterium]